MKHTRILTIILVLSLVFSLALPCSATDNSELFTQVRSATEENQQEIGGNLWSALQTEGSDFLTSLYEAELTEVITVSDLTLPYACGTLLASYHKNAGTEAEYLTVLFSLFPTDLNDATQKNEKDVLFTLFMSMPIPGNCADDALIDAMFTVMPVMDGAYAEHLSTLLYQAFMQAPQHTLTILAEKHAELSGLVVSSLVIEGSWSSNPEEFSALVAGLPNDKTLSDAARAIAGKLDSAVNAQMDPTTEPVTEPKSEPTEVATEAESAEPPVSTEPEPSSEPATIVEKATVAPLEVTPKS